jgi:hypothetical protein
VEGQRGEAEFVALALAPGRDRPPHVHPTIVSDSSLLETDLTGYDCVVLCNVARLRPEELELLGSYVHEGGGIVVLLGDRVQPSSYNRAVASANPTSWFMPAKVGEIRGDSLLNFDPLDYEHPIVAPFRGHERSGLLSAPIWRYWYLDHDPDGARVALRLTDGSPALITATVGRGRSVLLATSASPAAADRSQPWSALPLWPSFPPLMREMVDFAVRGRLDRQNLRVGQLITGSFATGAASARPAIEDPRGATHQLAVNFGINPPRWVFEETYLSGVYEVSEGGQGTVRRFSVNVDPLESDLRRIPSTVLTEFLSPLEDRSEEVTPASGTSPSRLFRLLLACLLGLILSESIVARWVGRGAT